ncbi:hypothetical protein [Methylomonas koyamae]|uniref:hypothetical protein n=1 Tax=Methylomonas koyamae TaxID=702114 RepID=UPI000B320319|nr:hypothetical protein [Methylomonas koyamae]
MGSRRPLALRNPGRTAEPPTLLYCPLPPDYFEDVEDVRAAKAAIEEAGGVSLEDFRAEHGV